MRDYEREFGIVNPWAIGILGQTHGQKAEGTNPLTSDVQQTELRISRGTLYSDAP